MTLNARYAPSRAVPCSEAAAIPSTGGSVSRQRRASRRSRRGTEARNHPGCFGPRGRSRPHLGARLGPQLDVVRPADHTGGEILEGRVGNMEKSRDKVVCQFTIPRVETDGHRREFVEVPLSGDLRHPVERRDGGRLVLACGEVIGQAARRLDAQGGQRTPDQVARQLLQRPHGAIIPPPTAFCTQDPTLTLTEQPSAGWIARRLERRSLASTGRASGTRG